MRRRIVVPCSLVAMAASTACSPELDWREVRPGGGHVVALFPCKPDALTRRLQLAGAKVDMTLHACVAGGSTYALSYADVADPARVDPVLDALASAARANIAAREVLASTAPSVAGATPGARAGRWTMRGRLSDGREVHAQAALFAYGTSVYQATVMSASADATAAETFFGALRVQP
jgi:hypothetical protein